jgi:hypothetical protein
MDHAAEIARRCSKLLGGLAMKAESVLANMRAELHGLLEIRLRGLFDVEPMDLVCIGRILERMTQLVRDMKTYKARHGISDEGEHPQVGTGKCDVCGHYGGDCTGERFKP